MPKIINSDGQILDLNGQVITVEKYNPLFNDADKLFQDKSFPGTAPDNENNRVFFKNGQLLEAANSAYLLPVRVIDSESLIISGNIYYRISDKGFEFTLEPNLTAVNYLLKNSRLTDVRTLDANFTIGDTKAKLEAHMLDTCINPSKHNYIFFPVSNPNLGPSGKTSHGFINFYSRDSNKFVTDGKEALANTPFFKLKYILKNIAQYLGFVTAGEFFTDPAYDNIVIFSRVAFDGGVIFPSMRYMPYMLISDFIKFLRERMHLAIDFNLGSGVMTAETFRTIKNSSAITDLTEYLVKGYEQELPESKGYKVSLKTDDEDESFAVTVGDSTEYLPLNFLTVGDGETEVELECGTTNFTTSDTEALLIYPLVDQLMRNPTFDEYDRNGAPIYQFPLEDPWDTNSGNDWPIKLMQFIGFREVSTGKSYPCATNYGLNADDVDYYKFINDSKRLILKGNFPPSVMVGFNNTKKYCFRTSGMNYVYFLIEHIAYDLTENERVPVQMWVRMLNYDAITVAKIETNLATTLPSNKYTPFKFKAYYDPAVHGFKDLNLQVNILPAPPGGALKTLVPIQTPSNFKGSGGQVVGVSYRDTAGATTIELRISQGQPKFVEYMGVRNYFAYDAAGYFKATLTSISYALQDYHWICF